MACDSSVNAACCADEFSRSAGRRAGSWDSRCCCSKAARCASSCRDQLLDFRLLLDELFPGPLLAAFDGRLQLLEFLTLTIEIGLLGSQVRHVLFELMAAVGQLVTPGLDLGKMLVEFAMLFDELALLLLAFSLPRGTLYFELALHFLNCLNGFRYQSSFQGSLFCQANSQ